MSEGLKWFKFRGGANDTIAAPQPPIIAPIPQPPIIAPIPQPAGEKYAKLTLRADGKIILTTATDGTFSSGQNKTFLFFKRLNYNPMEKGADL